MRGLVVDTSTFAATMKTQYIDTINWVKCNAPLDCCTTSEQPTAAAISSAFDRWKKVNKEKNMTNHNLNVSVETDVNTNRDVANSKDYLASRLSAIYHAKDHALRKDFGLDNDNEPRDGKEMVERILAGKYVLKTLKSCWDSTTSEQIIWRDPAIKEDRAGYKIAEKTLDDLRTKTKDEIKIFDPEKGLESLRAFETATIH